jgi:hypothetical protein
MWRMLNRCWITDLAHLIGWHITMIYQDLVANFAYHTFSDAREAGGGLAAYRGLEVDVSGHALVLQRHDTG